MNTFERQGDKIKHYTHGELRASINIEHVAEYREFVPELPLQPEEAEPVQTAQSIPPQLDGYVTLVQPVGQLEAVQ